MIEKYRHFFAGIYTRKCSAFRRCSKGILKAACESWLAAAGTEKEAEETKKLIAELEEDIIPVDGLIAFAASEAGVQVFGKEMAANIEAHGKELKAQGAKYCDCPACSAVAAILEKKGEL